MKSSENRACWDRQYNRGSPEGALYPKALRKVLVKGAPVALRGSVVVLQEMLPQN